MVLFAGLKVNNYLNQTYTKLLKEQYITPSGFNQIAWGNLPIRN